MARNTVTIDGVQLTREQVEQALKELNKPTKFPERTFLRRTEGRRGRFVVPSSGAEIVLRKGWSDSDTRQIVICVEESSSCKAGYVYVFDIAGLVQDTQ